MKKNIFFILAVIMGLSSCRNSSNDILNKFYNSNIIIPNNLELYDTSKIDINSYPYNNSKYKYIVYYDSTTVCTSCNIQKINRWNDLIEWSSDKTDIKYYFIMSSKKNKISNILLRKDLKLISLNYPIYIDSAYLFKKINSSIPDNPKFNTFLLDGDNKVILIGDPIGNPKIEELFKNIILGKVESNDLSNKNNN